MCRIMLIKKQQSVSNKTTVASKHIKPIPLRKWYSSTDLKTLLGPVVSALFELNKSISALGTPDKPLIVLARYIDDEWAAVPITIEDAREAWSEVTAAVLFFGVPFIISRRGEHVAVMRRHPENRHNAFNFARQYHDVVGPQEDTTLLQALEAQTAAFRAMSDQLTKIGQSQEILYRIAVKVWRREERHDSNITPPNMQPH
jgi:hypothetical protein